ncbi:MAG: DUF3810 domain-containing protein [Lachnospiraceae bacterium]|nr:DUF3810 domain-containing protein [Lachnospiraceae bacterium]
MKKKNFFVLLGVLLVTILINVIAWQSTVFCDFYVKHVFPLWINTYGRITGLVSFSVGEIMIALGVILIAFAVLLGLTAVIFLAVAKHFPICSKVKLFCKYFYKSLAGVLVIVFAVMTLNCFTLYHCSTFDEKYLQTEKEEYSLEELMNLRDYVVIQANALSAMVDRDEHQNIIYSGNMEETAIRSMQSLGEQYDQLAGYYPTPKPIATSDFLSQQHMKGYYFPFSMEANYNKVMDTMNKPATMCHELAHLKGFIYEDEANLIGFLACINSDDVAFQYSGYLSVLNYIDNDFYESINRNKEIYKSHVQIKSRVKKDNVFLTEETWQEVEKKAVIKTATVKKASNAFVDTTLVLNGIPDGSLSYTRVVGLMLDYYDCNCDIYENGTYLVKGQ